jgi:hypothetical protein
MSIAAVITVYKKPELVGALVRNLGKSHISVHIDKKVQHIEPFLREIESNRSSDFPPVRLLKRHVCHWGNFGLVNAHIEGIKWFLEETDASHLLTLTGQCSPIGSIDEIEALISTLGDRSIMECEPFPRAGWARDDGGNLRYQKIFLSGIWSRPRAIPFLRRPLPRHLTLHGGSGYFCISRRAAEDVIRFIHDNPRLVLSFKSTLIPDEMFFQTAVMASPNPAPIINQPTHYHIFSATSSPSPQSMGECDLDMALASECLFARKFDDILLANQCASLVHNSDLEPVREFI